MNNIRCRYYGLFILLVVIIVGNTYSLAINDALPLSSLSSTELKLELELELRELEPEPELLGPELELELELLKECNTDDGYSMYVWRNGFNSTAEYCNGVYPTTKVGSNATCFAHNWETLEARNKLWSSCSLPERKVTRIFLADVKSRIEYNGRNNENENGGECDLPLLDLLKGAHDRGIVVYALFAVSNKEFSESDMAVYPNQFNIECGQYKEGIYFDGVAVNNEYFSKIRDCDSNDENTVYIEEQQTLLDNLQLTVTNASPLPVHFSVSWNWDCCDCSSTNYNTRNLFWPEEDGPSFSVLKHMINIVDSIDVQVAYNKPSTMKRRIDNPYHYWLDKQQQSSSSSSTSKVYTLSYTNPNNVCQVSFSPHVKGADNITNDICTIGNSNENRTQQGMFDAFDYVESENNHPKSKGSIHFLNGVYGTGITTGWPKHTYIPSPSLGCIEKRNNNNNNNNNLLLGESSDIPSNSPSYMSSSSPTSSTSTTTCLDSPLEIKMKNRKKSRNCNWVSNKKQKRCNKRSNKKQLWTHCRSTCNKCNKCKDSKQKFKIIIEGRNKSKSNSNTGISKVISCSDINDFKNTGNNINRELYCNIQDVALTCPKTCNIC